MILVMLKVREWGECEQKWLGILFSFSLGLADCPGALTLSVSPLMKEHLISLCVPKRLRTVTGCYAITANSNLCANPWANEGWRTSYKWKKRV